MFSFTDASPNLRQPSQPGWWPQVPCREADVENPQAHQEDWPAESRFRVKAHIPLTVLSSYRKTLEVFCLTSRQGRLLLHSLLWSAPSCKSLDFIVLMTSAGTHGAAADSATMQQGPGRIMPETHLDSCDLKACCEISLHVCHVRMDGTNPQKN